MDFETFKMRLASIDVDKLVVKCEPIVDLSTMCAEVKKEKKSVRFSDNVKEQKFDEPRENNICPKYELPKTNEDISEFFCRGGLYLDDTENIIELIENGRFNCGDKVNDKELRGKTHILEKKKVQSERKTNYMLHSDPVSYLTTTILLDGNDIISTMPIELLLDCILNMMEIYEYLETEGSSCTISYRESVSISNRQGKRQRGIVKRKIEQLSELYL